MKKQTPERVRRLVAGIKERKGLSQADVAGQIGMSVSGLKKAMATGKTYREIGGPAYQLLQLLADEHPHWQLIAKTEAKQKKRSGSG